MKLNQTLINLAANHKNFRALSLSNLEHVTETKIFGNSRDWYLYGHCFSMGGSVLLANRIASQVKSFLTGPKKVLVVDLDNTLWGGVIGDDGVNLDFRIFWKCSYADGRSCGEWRVKGLR